MRNLIKVLVVFVCFCYFAESAAGEFDAIILNSEIWSDCSFVRYCVNAIYFVRIFFRRIGQTSQTIFSTILFNIDNGSTSYPFSQ